MAIWLCPLYGKLTSYCHRSLLPLAPLVPLRYYLYSFFLFLHFSWQKNCCYMKTNCNQDVFPYLHAFLFIQCKLLTVPIHVSAMLRRFILLYSSYSPYGLLIFDCESSKKWALHLQYSFVKNLFNLKSSLNSVHVFHNVFVPFLNLHLGFFFLFSSNDSLQ